MDCGIHSLSFSYTVVPTRFSNKLVSLLIVDNGAAACMSIGQWDSIPLVFFGLILRNSRTQGQSSRQELVFIIGKQWQTLRISCSRRMDEMLISHCVTCSTYTPAHPDVQRGVFLHVGSTDINWLELSRPAVGKAFAIEISSSELRCCSQLISWPMFFPQFLWSHPLLKLNAESGRPDNFMVAGARASICREIGVWEIGNSITPGYSVTIVCDCYFRYCYVMLLLSRIYCHGWRLAVRIANWNWQTLVWQSMCAQVWYICSAVQHCLDPKTLRCRFPIHVGAPNHSF